MIILIISSLPLILSLILLSLGHFVIAIIIFFIITITLHVVIVYSRYEYSLILFNLSGTHANRWDLLPAVPREVS